MKFFRTLTLIAVAAFAAFVATPSAHAQKAGTYQLLSSVPVAAGATNSYTPATTNQVVLRCDEFNSVGFTWTVNSTTNSQQILRIAKCYDGTGTAFEPTASVSFTNSASGSGTKYVVGSIDTTSCSHVAITAIENPTAGGSSTNTVQLFLKSPKYGAKASTQ